MLRAVRSSSLGREFSHPTQLNQKLQLFVTELKASDRCERIKPQARTSSGRRRPRPHRLTSWLLQSCRPEAVRVTAGNGFVVKHPATATRTGGSNTMSSKKHRKTKKERPPVLGDSSECDNRSQLDGVLSGHADGAPVVRS